MVRNTSDIKGNNICKNTSKTIKLYKYKEVLLLSVEMVSTIILFHDD